MNTHEDKSNESLVPQHIITAKEKRVRKHWIISLWTVTIIHALSLSINFYLTAVENGVVVEAPSVAIILLGSAVIASIHFMISYHCAYKERGTKWLTWTLVTLPLGLLSGLSRGGLPLVELSGAEIFALLFAIGVSAYYWINCLQLREVNSARKKTLAANTQ